MKVVFGPGVPLCAKDAKCCGTCDFFSYFYGMQMCSCPKQVKRRDRHGRLVIGVDYHNCCKSYKRKEGIDDPNVKWSPCGWSSTYWVQQQKAEEAYAREAEAQRKFNADIRRREREAARKRAAEYARRAEWDRENDPWGF